MSQWIYTPEQVRELDRIVIEEQGVPGYELMRRAGQVAFNAAREVFPAARRWQVFCGSGNNAGDGYVIAQLALDAGLQVQLIALADPEQLQGDAAAAYQGYAAAGGEVETFDAALSTAATADLCVDALLGTGLQRAVEGAYADAVRVINESGLPVLAVDVPSGLNGASGAIMGSAVRADVTATFVGLKQGLYLGAGPDHCGRVIYSDLGMAPVAPERVAPQLQCADISLLQQVMPPRDRGGHKGRYGHVLVIGGNHGMGGSVRLTGEAALRAGAGLVSVATRPDNVAAVVSGRPELMCHGVDGIDSAAELDELLARATVIALGPGIGGDDWARELFARAISTRLPLVVDADALNLLAAAPVKRDNWVLTPHPGEAGRLLGIDSGAVQADRLHALGALESHYGGVVVLKGAGTLITG
ncbi:MAG: NAD(P)H-hydrate dehydratase, partial [Gammaproteobacteria bacterium]|nr:NAD(P)H-hydrate dehydratase [Gammaproteobacteria bacterium]